jgi:hypothetical protein
MKQKLLILFLAMALPMLLRAQFYETGQDPGRIRWRQIKTDYFRLVYPDFAEAQAQHFANKLLWAATEVPKGMQHQPKRIDILMHMESSTSNAMVVWAPKRLEAHNTPPQDSYGEDWWEQLALHEFRHVVQVSKMRQGFTKVLSYVFGEAATGGILGAYIPLWFLEGDAVATETALSETGRGRNPDFSMDLKAQLLELGSYSYDKAYNGSYKNFIPDHYVLGYHLATLGQGKYGAGFWANSFDYTARNPYMIVPFSHSIKKQSGQTKVHFYSEIMHELDSIWQDKQEEIELWDFDTLYLNQSKFYTDFQMAHQIDSNRIVCLMSGLDDISRIVLIDIKEGKISTLHTPGYGHIDNLDYANGKVVWNERGFNPRWQHRRFMVLKTYDLSSGKVKKISARSYLFYPTFSQRGDTVAAMQVSPENQYSIVRISIGQGGSQSSRELPRFVKNPRFTGDGQKIVGVEIGPKGNSIKRYNLQGVEEKLLYGPSFENISNPILSGDTLLFISTLSGRSNVHALDLQSGKEYQLTSVPFGVNFLNLSYDKHLVFSSYSANGYLIGRQEIRFEHPAAAGKKDEFYKSYLTDNKGNIQREPPRDSLFESGKYHKITHLFNPHSWGPVGLNIDNIEVNPGITVASQNLLGTMINTFGYEYRMNEQTSRYWANLSYKGWYPVIDLDVEYEDRVGHLIYPDGYRQRFTFNSTNVGLDVSLPLNLTGGKYANFVYVSSGIYGQFLGANPSTPDRFPSGEHAVTMRYRLYAHHKLKRGLRDVETRWGQSIDLNFRNAPYGDLADGSLWSAEARLYFPGIGKHHSLRFYLATQQKEKDYYLSSDLILFPRGYSGIANDQFYSMRLDYLLPLFYPDFSLGSLAYFKRFKSALFYDYGQGTYDDDQGKSISTTYQSVGVDLRTDVHFLRHPAPFDIGLRTYYRLNDSSVGFELLFSVSY